jgi:DNA-binding transcriptional LysR family regulator
LAYKSIDMPNIAKLDLNLLVVLEAIYSEGGVSRAGEKLNLTQPAISHALARLRLVFDDPLFRREGRALVPTPLTRGLIAPLRRSLRELGLLLNEAGRFDPGRSEARFTVAMRDPVELLVLPAAMARIARAAPHVDLRSVQVARRNIETGLASGMLDLAMDVPLPLPERIHRERVAADRLVVVARRGHPALRRGLDLEAYLAQEHVMVTSRRKGPGFEDLALAERGLQRRVRLRCRNYVAAFRLVSETDLLLTMPERYAGVLNRAFANRVLPLPVETPTLDLYFYWHEAAASDPANLWLRGVLRDAFQASKRDSASGSGQASRLPTRRDAERPASRSRRRSQAAAQSRRRQRL